MAGSVAAGRARRNARHRRCRPAGCEPPGGSSMTQATRGRAVCVVWDGLRPDLVSPDVTPTLWRLARSGVWHTHAHSVFPSETRVATSSFSTGSYPAQHGIAANAIYAPSVDAK